VAVKVPPRTLDTRSKEADYKSNFWGVWKRQGVDSIDERRQEATWSIGLNRYKSWYGPQSLECFDYPMLRAWRRWDLMSHPPPRKLNAVVVGSSNLPVPY